MSCDVIHSSQLDPLPFEHLRYYTLQYKGLVVVASASVGGEDCWPPDICQPAYPGAALCSCRNS